MDQGRLPTVSRIAEFYFPADCLTVWDQRLYSDAPHTEQRRSQGRKEQHARLLHPTLRVQNSAGPSDVSKTEQRVDRMNSATARHLTRR